MAEKNTCVGKVSSPGGWSSHTCGKTAKVERDGKHYCGTHDPVAVKQKSDARQAAWKAKMDEKDARWDAQGKARAEQARQAGCFTSLLGALEDLVDDDDTPEPNCSCYLSPPCNDCVENFGRRELIARAKRAIAKAKEMAP